MRSEQGLRCRLCFFLLFHSASLHKAEEGDERLGSGPAFATKWSETMSRSFALVIALCSWLGIGRVGKTGSSSYVSSVSFLTTQIRQFSVLG